VSGFDDSSPGNLEVPAKASFVEYDDVVQALAANGSDHPFLSFAKDSAGTLNATDQ
jgi:hypothetical protein